MKLKVTNGKALTELMEAIDVSCDTFIVSACVAKGMDVFENAALNVLLEGGIFSRSKTSDTYIELGSTDFKCPTINVEQVIAKYGLSTDDNTFTLEDIVYALKEVHDVGNLIEIDLRDGNTSSGITVTLLQPEVEQKPRHLKRISQLKGLTIATTKTVKNRTVIKTTCGAGLIMVDGIVKTELSTDEYLALGILTKEDLAAVARAKKMGVF